MFYAYEKNGEIKTTMAASPPENSLGKVPESISRDDFDYLKVTQSNDPQTGDPINVITVDAAKKAVGLAEKTKVDDVSSAYQTMSDEIDAKMYDVFRTLKPEYATAEYNTWKDMLDRPAAYASLGLKVDHQINNTDNSELFSPGSALDTAQKVLDFAQRKIQLAQDYGTFRMQKLQEFRNQKETIENS